MYAGRKRKAGSGLESPGLARVRFGEPRRSAPLELEDFVLDAELLALQIGDGVVVGKGTPVLLIDGALKLSMLCSERLDAILQRHALFLLLDDDAPDGNAGRRKRPD